MSAYYNEIDPFAAQWLRNLIAAGLIAPGDVDERSIVEVQPDDLRGYDQCHFFAGIGGWSHALRLAGWDDRRPVWTGSCPCQPFSAAGKGLGERDERHLWPEFRRLIAECRPGVVFGEQVASAVGHGWLDGVFADLEAEDYACGAAVLGAHSVGAPHIRQRLWWVADADQGQRGRLADGEGREHDGQAAGWQQGDGVAQPGGAASRLANADAPGQREQWRGGLLDGERPARGHDADGCGAVRAAWSDYVWLPCADGKARRIGIDTIALVDGLPDFLAAMQPDDFAEAAKEVIRHGTTVAQRPGQIVRAVREAVLSRPAPDRPVGESPGVCSTEVLLAYLRELEARCEAADENASRPSAFEVAMRSVPIDAATSRPSHRREPRQLGGEQHPDALHALSRVLAQHAQAAWATHWRKNAKPFSPLSIGEPGRVGRLRGYGNAIVPQVAAEFIQVFEECRP